MYTLYQFHLIPLANLYFLCCPTFWTSWVCRLREPTKPFMFLRPSYHSRSKHKNPAVILSQTYQPLHVYVQSFCYIIARDYINRNNISVISSVMVSVPVPILRVWQQETLEQEYTCFVAHLHNWLCVLRVIVMFYLKDIYIYIYTYFGLFTCLHFLLLEDRMTLTCVIHNLISS